MAKSKRRNWWIFKNGSYRLYVEKKGREFHGIEEKWNGIAWQDTCPGCTIITDTLREMMEEGSVEYNRNHLTLVG